MNILVHFESTEYGTAYSKRNTLKARLLAAWQPCALLPIAYALRIILARSLAVSNRAGSPSITYVLHFHENIEVGAHKIARKGAMRGRKEGRGGSVYERF